MCLQAKDSHDTVAKIARGFFALLFRQFSYKMTVFTNIHSHVLTFHCIRTDCISIAIYRHIRTLQHVCSLQSELFIFYLFRNQSDLFRLFLLSDLTMKSHRIKFISIIMRTFLTEHHKRPKSVNGTDNN